MTGAVAGFSIGFLVDCLLVEALGGHLAGPARRRLPGRPLPRALRDPQRAGAAAALHGPDPVRRARLRRGAGDARRRRPGQRADRPRHAAEEHLRLLPRLADLLRRAARPAPGAGRGAAGRRAAASRPCWGPRSGDVPALRRARPADEQPPGAADRDLRRRRRWPSSRALLPALVPAGAQRRKYLAEAKNNRTREFRVSAPRGEILDRNGKVLVANRTSLALQVNPQQAARRPTPAPGRADAARRADPQHAAPRCAGRCTKS